jgi:preprotein translocase subunit SecD
LQILETVALDERDIAKAYPTTTPNDLAVIGVDFNSEGAKKMEALTSANIGRRLAIIVDGNLLSTPTIRAAISGSAVIEGGAQGYSPEQVQSLAKDLNEARDQAPKEHAPTTRQ